MTVVHGGNIWAHAARLGCKPSDILDMSSNVNPFGPMPGLTDYLKERIDDIGALPEPDGRAMVDSVARFYDIGKDRILAGNGTTQWIHAIGPAFNCRRVLIACPTYGEYVESCKAHAIPVTETIARAGDAFDFDLSRLDTALSHCDAAFICNPNNPTGRLIPRQELAWLFGRHPDTLFIVDESYLPFCDSAAEDSFVHSALGNVVVLNSMSKIFRIPGLRIGFAIGPEPFMKRLAPHGLPWSVNALAQAAVRYIMDRPDAARRFMATSRNKLAIERQWLTDRLTSQTRLQVFPSVTSFVMVRLPEGHVAAEVVASLVSHRILIRNCDNFTGLSEKYVRVSLKDREANRQLADRLHAMFS